MTTIRQFNCEDFFKYNCVEISDQPRSLTYPSLGPYLRYLSEFSEYFLVAESPNGDIMGYIMGTDEETAELDEYGYVCLLVCSPVYRNIGTGTRLLESFENISKHKKHRFIDLHVQPINWAAIGLYQKSGFSIVDYISDYYSIIPEAAAYVMRKWLL